MVDWANPELWRQLDILLWGGAAGLAFASLLEFGPRLERWWLKRRLRRRLENDPWILEQELREHEYAIGLAEEDDDRPGLPERLTGFLVHLGVGVLFVLVGVTFGEGYVFALMVGGAAFAALGWLWKRINDPPQERAHGPYAGPPDLDVLDEAIRGFAAAIVALLFIGVAIWMFV